MSESPVSYGKTIWNAAEYDGPRRRLVPCFDDFYGAVGEVVGWTAPSAPRVLDLGAGTGLASVAVLRARPRARLTLLDGDPSMLARAVDRFAADPAVAPVDAVVGDLTGALPPGPFDAIVSSIAVHHLSAGEKRALYGRVRDALVPGGVFVNADQVLGADPATEAHFDRLHLAAARARGSGDEEVAGAVGRMRHDRSDPLADQLSWLTEAGFAAVDCVYRWYRFAVLTGRRPLS